MSEKEPPEQRPDKTGIIEEGKGYTRNPKPRSLLEAAIRGNWKSKKLPEEEGAKPLDEPPMPVDSVNTEAPPSVSEKPMPAQSSWEKARQSLSEKPMPAPPGKVGPDGERIEEVGTQREIELLKKSVYGAEKEKKSTAAGTEETGPSAKEASDGRRPKRPFGKL